MTAKLPASYPVCLNEGNGARLKSALKDVEPVRTRLHRPGLFTATAPPVTGAELPPLVSLCARPWARFCLKGKTFCL